MAYSLIIRLTLFFFIVTQALTAYWPLIIIPISLDKVILLIMAFFVFLSRLSDVSIKQYELFFYLFFLIFGMVSLVSLTASGIVFWIFLAIMLFCFSYVYTKEAYFDYIKNGVLISLVVVFVFSLYQVYFILVYKSFPTEVPFSFLAAPVEGGNNLIERGGLRLGTDFYRLFMPFQRAQDYAFFIGCFSVTYVILRLSDNRLQSKKYTSLIIPGVIVVSLLFISLSGSRSTLFPYLFMLLIPLFTIFASSLIKQKITLRGILFSFISIVVVGVFFTSNFNIVEEMIISRIQSGDYGEHYSVRQLALYSFDEFNLTSKLFGVGHYNYMKFAGGGVYPHAHMTYLTFFVEYGPIFGTIIYTLFTCLPFLLCWRISKRILSSIYFKHLVCFGVPLFFLLCNIFYEFGKSHYYYVCLMVIAYCYFFCSKSYEYSNCTLIKS